MYDLALPVGPLKITYVVSLMPNPLPGGPGFILTDCSVIVGHSFAPLFRMSGLGDPTSSYATFGVALASSEHTIVAARFNINLRKGGASRGAS